MTPLFHRIVKELTLPPKRRTFENRSINESFFSKLSDVHCFELTEVKPILNDLGAQYFERSSKNEDFSAAVDERTAFLPAPRTWLEWKRYDDNSSDLLGVLLEDYDGLVLVTFCAAQHDFFGAAYELQFPLKDHQDFREIRVNKRPGVPSENWQISFIFCLYAALAIINTPRIMGRRQHMPHRGLERRLTNLFRPQGKFPLHAWTEIKLEVAAPHWASDEPSTEAHLTGHKALHFCRAHLRIRLGRLEIVRSHWRGDASLGIRQSRYKLQPGAGALP